MKSYFSLFLRAVLFIGCVYMKVDILVDGNRDQIEKILQRLNPIESH